MLRSTFTYTKPSTRKYNHAQRHTHTLGANHCHGNSNQQRLPFPYYSADMTASLSFLPSSHYDFFLLLPLYLWFLIIHFPFCDSGSLLILSQWYKSSPHIHSCFIFCKKSLVSTMVAVKAELLSGMENGTSVQVKCQQEMETFFCLVWSKLKFFVCLLFTFLCVSCLFR